MHDQPSTSILRFLFVLLALTSCFLLPMIARAQVYVDGNPSVPGPRNGVSWNQAFDNIQDAIDLVFARGGGEIWIADGRYATAISIKNGVQLYGGFEGYGGAEETTRNQRDPQANETIIDGSTARTGAPAYHVVVMEGIINTVLDGFIITGGSADGAGATDTCGGGIYCVNTDDTNTITDCAITSNTAIGVSGADGIDGGSPTDGNPGGDAFGAGIYCSNASPTILRCTFTKNAVTGGQGGAGGDYTGGMGLGATGATGGRGVGGGVYCGSSSSPGFQDCEISSNTATGGDGGDGGGGYRTGNAGSGGQSQGGGICSDSLSFPSFSNCRVTSNTAIGGQGGAAQDAGTAAGWGGNGGASGGGGVCCASSLSIRFANCSIMANTASGGDGGDGGGGMGGGQGGDGGVGHGGGFYGDAASSTTLFNCRLSHNSASGGIGGGGGGARNGGAGGAGGMGQGGGICCSSLSLLSSTNGITDNNTVAGGDGGSGGDGYNGGDGGTGSDGQGGAAYCDSSSSVTLQNCTIYGQACTGGQGGRGGVGAVSTGTDGADGMGKGGGAYCAGDLSTVLRNTIFSSNQAFAIYEGREGATPLMQNDLFHANSDGAYRRFDGEEIPDVNIGQLNGTNGASGNISGNPLFADAAVGDLHILSNSIAIDMGSSINAPRTDADGLPRPIDFQGIGEDGPGEGFDIGAYEYQRGGAESGTMVWILH